MGGESLQMVQYLCVSGDGVNVVGIGYESFGSGGSASMVFT